MALLGDRVQETTTTTGTGSFALNGAVTGYVTFNSTFVNGDIVWYVCDNGSGDWEIGTGTVGTGTLTRTVFQSSNANALVPFAAGAKRIFCTAPYTYLLPDQTGNTGKILTTNGSTPSWTTQYTGTVTAVSVTSANGLAGTSSGGATPALTLSTTVTGLLKGNGTGISAAVAGTDYAAANATFTLGSTSVALGSTTSTVAGLTLTNPTINGFTGNTSVVNIGSGQFYKDTSGNVGIGTSSPVGKADAVSNAYAAFVARASTSGVGQTVDALKILNSDASQFANAKYTALSHQWYDQNLAEKMRLDTSGNLGLGVTPSGWGSAFKVIQYLGGFAGSQSSAYLYSGQNAYYDGTNWKRVAAGYASLLEQSNGQFLFYNAGTSTAGNAISFTQAMTLDASGNLGVGSTSPVNFGSGSKGLTLNGTGNYQNIAWQVNGTSIALAYTNGTGGGFLIGTEVSAPLIFTTVGTERARIDSSGNLTVGDTSNVGYRLYAKGATSDNTTYPIVVRNAAATNLFYIDGTGLFSTGIGTNSPYNSTTASAANTFVASSGVLQRSTSSARYKNTITNAVHGLAEVLKLRPVTYKGNNDGDTVFGGLIAEEVHDTGLTEFVQYNEDGEPDALSYGNMVSLAFKAIQELSAELNELKKRIN